LLREDDGVSWIAEHLFRLIQRFPSVDYSLRIAGNHHSLKEAPVQPKLPKDATSLEQRKQALRAQFAVRPLRPEEFERQEDVRWARQDPEVLAQHRGEFVVPYQRQIVAHGADAAAVLAEAAQITGRAVEELPLVGIIDPLLDMPR
jgi:hypothetical protein